MLELIILVCAIVAAIFTPMEAKKVHGGWVSPRFKGTPEEFRAKYVKQLKSIGWIALVVGVLYIAIGIPLSDSTEEIVMKLVIGGIWIAVALINMAMRRKYFEPVASA